MSNQGVSFQPAKGGQLSTGVDSGGFKTKIDQAGELVTLNVFYKNSRLKQYLNCDMRSHAASEYVNRRFGNEAEDVVRASA